MKESQRNGTAGTTPAWEGWVRAWPRWAPYAAAAWSLIYASLGIYWAAGWGGFPFTPESASSGMGPLVARFGAGVTWIVVTLAGIPAVVLGAAMLRGLCGRLLRPACMTAGILLAGLLLLFVTDLNLLTLLGYIPFTIFRLVTGGDVSFYLQEMAPGARGPPAAVPRRRFPLVGCDRRVWPMQRGGLPVLRPPGRPGGVV